MSADGSHTSDGGVEPARGPPSDTKASLTGRPVGDTSRLASWSEVRKFGGMSLSLMPPRGPPGGREDGSPTRNGTQVPFRRLCPTTVTLPPGCPHATRRGHPLTRWDGKTDWHLWSVYLWCMGLTLHHSLSGGRGQAPSSADSMPWALNWNKVIWFKSFSYKSCHFFFPL